MCPREFKPKLKFTDPGKHQIYKEYLRVDEYDPDIYFKKEDTLSDAIGDVLKKYDMDNHVLVEELIEKWKQIFPGPIGKHTAPSRMNNCTLYIAVDNTVWLNELKRYHTKNTLDKVKKETNMKIKYIVFHIKQF